MKLNRLQNIANQAIRTSCRRLGRYMIDPFYHYTPKEALSIDLKTKEFNTERNGDDVEEYYSMIIN
ncbi:MAG: hypothetical protein BAJALOKI1v1_1400002 [Promethearchaeota archaeon]|nr:MAG: hypothetical protein BAJALOKI1v1_1400002 [Candidatus Lokiarchaeota archaeon]